MDWLALLFNMRGIYQLCSVFEEGVLAHQSIRRYDGRNWTGKNVLQRRNQLRKIIRPDTSVQVSSFIAGHGIELFRLAKEKGLEGIRGVRLHRRKRLSQTFWRTATGRVSKRTAVLFRSLRYWFSEKGLKEAIDRLKPLFTGKPPVENPPAIPEKIQWVQPNTQQGFMELFAGSMIGLTCTGTRAPSTPWVEDSWRRGGSGASSETPQFGMGPKGGVHYTRNLAFFGLGYETNLGVRTKATGS